MTSTPDTREAPQALEAERSVLAAMMLEREAVARARALLQPDAFYRTGHAQVYRAILALDDRGEIADRVSLADEMRSRGEFEAAGGHETLGAILEYATTTANLEAHCRAVRTAWSKRRALRIAGELPEALANGSHGVTVSEVLGSIGSRLSQVAAEVEPGARPPTLLEQVKSVRDAFEHPLPASRDLIGSGYFVEGGFSLVASLPGHGKSYLAIQAMRCLALGIPWLDFQCAQGRSLMLQMEMAEYEVLERMARVRREVEDVCDLLTQPEGFTAISDPKTLDDLSRIVEVRKIAFLPMDPVNKLHGAANPNYDQEMGPFFDAIHKLRNRTGVHVQLIHHLNKIEFDKGASLRTNALLSVKGCGRLCADPQTVIVLMQRNGRQLLVNAKTRLGPSVESIAIRQDPETGWFARVSTPEEISEGSDRKLEACLRLRGDEGATLDQICEECGMSSGTARRHLDELGAVKLGGGRGRGRVARYYLPSLAPQEAIGGDGFETQEPASEEGQW